jgi:hypothetical protein
MHTAKIAIVELQLPKNLTPSMGHQINYFTLHLLSPNDLTVASPTFPLSCLLSSCLLHTNLFTYIKKLMAPNLRHGDAEGNELMQLWSHLDPEECKEWERLVEWQMEEFSLTCCVSQVLELIKPFISFTYSCIWCRKSSWDRNLLSLTMQW